LLCLAGFGASVAELRRRKGRPESLLQLRRPIALGTAHCVLSPRRSAALHLPAAPDGLLAAPARPSDAAIAPTWPPTPGWG